MRCVRCGGWVHNDHTFCSLTDHMLLSLIILSKLLNEATGLGQQHGISTVKHTGKNRGTEVLGYLSPAKHLANKSQPSVYSPTPNHHLPLPLNPPPLKPPPPLNPPRPPYPPLSPLSPLSHSPPPLSSSLTGGCRPFNSLCNPSHVFLICAYPKCIFP